MNEGVLAIKGGAVVWATRAKTADFARREYD